MARSFNVSGPCRPDKHYMVDLESRLEEIRQMIDAGEYFVINRARQYGKTTILRALSEYLKREYQVLSLDFQNIESDEFSNGNTFVHALARETIKRIRRMEDVPGAMKEKLCWLADSMNQCVRIAELFACFSEWCGQSEKPVVLLVDEVDTAADNQVFLDFLAQLRAAYLDSDITPAFQSVILAGVYDIRNIRQKLRPEEEHKENSPWNIAADFLVDMSFSVNDIAGMLKEYEADYQIGIETGAISRLLYDYTSGYPYLVSRLCKLMDERIAGTVRFPDKASVWTKDGCTMAVKMLLEENNPLFDSLMNKLMQFPELKSVISRQLFQGQPIAYSPDDRAVRNARMFGFVKVEDSTVQIANRIFETRLYNRFLLEYQDQDGGIYIEGARQKVFYALP
ncbi:AAA-like domain-containing protein [Lachnospiraceae bacterium 62-26]